MQDFELIKELYMHLLEMKKDGLVGLPFVSNEKLLFTTSNKEESLIGNEDVQNLTDKIEPQIVNLRRVDFSKKEFPNKIVATTSGVFKFTKILKQNVIDNEVKELQKYLNSKGYTLAQTGPGSPGNETTKFGPLTKKAVIKFQLANRLTADGVVGQKTREIIK